MRKYLLIILLFSNASVFAAWGLWDANRSDITFNVKGTPTTKTVWNSGAGNYQSYDFGTFVTGNVFQLTVFNVRTWKNSGGDVTGGAFYYVIYQKGFRPTTPTFTGISLEWKENLGGSGDQRWGITPTIDVLSGLSAGEYTIEIYCQVNGTTPNTSAFDNNNGNSSNYTAHFRYNYVRSTVDAGWTSGTTWLDNIVPNSSSISVEINNAVTVDGDYECNALIVNNGKSLTINSSKSLTISGNLNNSGSFTINSDGTGTGSLITNGTVSGNITFERYLPQNLFHYISCPINYSSGAFADLSMGLASGDDFRKYETSSNTWIDILNGPDGVFGNTDDLMDNETFVTGKGYAIAYAGENKTLSFTGSPNNGDIDVAVSSGGVGLNSGANFVGNPYPSTLKASDFLASNNSTNGTINQTIKGTLYFWDEPVSGGFEKADYATRTSSAGNPGGGSNTPTDYINPGQGFFVSAVASGNIAFRNAQRAHGSSVFFKEEVLLKDFKLQVKNLETSDQNTITIVFDNNSTPGFDELYDAPKWQGNPDLALYSLLGEKKLAIQSLPDTDESISVKIGLKVSTSGNFVFSVYSIENFDPSTPITLEDNLTGDQTDLTINPEYSFSISEAGTYNDRFVLHFKSGVGISEPTTHHQPIVYFQNPHVNIRNLQPGSYQITVSDIAGRRVAAKKVTTDGSIEMPLSLQTGVYIVEISSETSRFANKIFIK